MRYDDNIAKFQNVVATMETMQTMQPWKNVQFVLHHTVTVQ